jgi:hypothetical protein
MPIDGEVEIPIDGDSSGGTPNPPSGGGSLENGSMTPEDVALLKLHAHNNGQRQADNQVVISKAQDYSYLTGKDSLTQAGAMAMRYLQGPHPQFGTPDGKAA